MSAAAWEQVPLLTIACCHTSTECHCILEAAALSLAEIGEVQVDQVSALDVCRASVEPTVLTTSQHIHHIQS